ncbi:LytR/AlgR family response regulator transcription factor [Pedobacter mucosus]|uniref:LytR/AlgR family response regulator transcription factor n=1 Tax=Pedobacter mucosus TaxID=2895286 RepID=UPI001EE458EB|nr:LytTR family DNA-binding domain-containing protein [Pedobacter mucosus]UKT65048.1 LytTR family DNA-binding domain-containing protein [Pedobacter mucosus]
MQLTSIVIDDEPHAIAEICELIEITPGLSNLESFESAGDALDFLKNAAPVDIIFCDISMPNVDGLQAAGILSEFCEFLVYITAHRFHGPETYEVNASGYLLKPLKYDKFIRQIKELQKIKTEALWAGPQDETIFVKGNDKNSVLSINSQDIIFIQGLDNYIKFHTTNGEKTTYMQLKDLDATLMKKNNYLRVAKSTIISLRYLEKVDGYVAYMKTGEVFNIGKVYRPAFNNLLHQRRLN